MQLDSLITTLTRVRTIRPLDRLSQFVAALSPGDKLIAGALGLLVFLASVASIYALEQSLLVSEPTYGGTLTEGVVGSPRFINPLLALSDSDRDLTALVYAGLMGEDASGKLVPVLASGYTVSEDGKTYTFTLKEDATFSDGTPVSAEDVVYTVQKAQDPALKSPEYANWAGVSAEATDVRTVVFRLGKPYAPFLENTTLGILPAYLWKDVSDEEFAFSDLNTAPVGAGPFTLDDVKKNSSGIVKEIDLAANEDYILGRPYLAGITFLFYGEQADLADAVAKGAVESAYGVPSGSMVEAPYSRVFGVFFNQDENPVFTHIEVRKALSVAIDREKIASDVLGGFATPLAGPVPPGSGVRETPVPTSTDRIAEAKDILTRNGWAYDEEAREWKQAKANAVLSVTLKTSNVPELKAVASAVKEDWEALGVPVTVELYEPGDLTQNVIRPRNYDALLFGMVIGRDRDLYAFWDSAERNDPGLNIALYANKSVDTLLEAARATSDQAEASEDLAKAAQLIAEDYPAAFTHAPEFVYTIPKGLHGVALPQIAAPSDRFAGVTGWYLKTERVWPFLADK